MAYINYSDALARVKMGPPSYSQYIGKKYKYGSKILTIVGVYNYDYLRIVTEGNDWETYYHAKSFLEDVENGVYEKVN